MSDSIFIKRYTPDLKREWNNFAADARQRVLLFQRDYMDYHRDRFEDFSLMAYKGKRLIGLLPCEREGDIASSHRGLTFGGWLTPIKHFDINDMGELLMAMKNFLGEHGIKHLDYKAIPSIYHLYPAEEDEFILSKTGAEIIKTEANFTIDLSSELSLRTDMRTGIKKAENNHVAIGKSDDFEQFWGILRDRLSEKYDAKPVHTLQEIRTLQLAFPENIVLFAGFSTDGEMIGGCVVYISDTTAKIQYTATTQKGRDLHTLPLLINRIADHYKGNKRFLDFGTSNGSGNYGVNESLANNKYGLGARCTLTREYRITI